MKKQGVRKVAIKRALQRRRTFCPANTETAAEAAAETKGQTLSASLAPARSSDAALAAPRAGGADYTARAEIDDRTRVEDGLEEKPASCAELGLDGDRLQRVLDYISASVRSELNLEELALIACYSPFHFARKFTRSMGVTPQRYIRRLRLKNAMEELAAGKLSLAEIALNASFSSQASFTRAFHRTFGTTPNEYRRRRRSGTAQAQTSESAS